jgi:hypothetical protein
MTEDGAVAFFAGPQRVDGVGQALLGGLGGGDIPNDAEHAGNAIDLDRRRRYQDPDDLPILPYVPDLQMPRKLECSRSASTIFCPVFRIDPES